MEKNEEITCCTTHCDKPLDQQYWDAQWIENAIGWDIGYASPPLAGFIDTIGDKDAAVLIPGCGNAYEAEYLVSKGFTNISLIDISPAACAILQKKFANSPQVKIFCEDFFTHRQQYDYVIEQTFFCALNPALRVDYVHQMHRLLKPGGVLSGLLFDKQFEKAGPPFGGTAAEYKALFKAAFAIEQMYRSPNSIPPRAGSELFFIAKKNATVQTHLYRFSGITCSGCRQTIIEKLNAVADVQNSYISNDFATLLIVSGQEVQLAVLQQAVSYDEKYAITPL